jgi:hypothetical protein
MTESSDGSHNARIRQELLSTVTELEHELARLDGIQHRLSNLNGEIASQHDHTSKNLHQFIARVLQGVDSPSALLEATKQLQETQMSFDLQFLELQDQLQNENRSYTAVANIMKTKHDTVKNTIANIR